MSENIVTRIEAIAKEEGMTITALERELGASKGVLSRAAAKGTDISCKWVQKLVEKFPLYNPSWILTGGGRMRFSPAEQSQNAPDSTFIDAVGRKIPLISIENFTNFVLENSKNVDISEDNDSKDNYIEGYYQVHEFRTADFLIRIQGNSMYPKYSSGDLVACRKLDNTNFFQWNKIYAICTRSQGVLVKRVQKSVTQACITLVSDNPKYKPFDVPVSDIEAVALVVGAISIE